MAAGFRALVRRRRDGSVVFDLDLVHAGVVAEALEQTRGVLTDSGNGAAAAGRSDAGAEASDDFDAIVSRLGDVGEESSAQRSRVEEGLRDDPVVRRLLPDAFLDDPDASAEFRRLSADTVRGHKVEAIESVLADLATLQQQKGGLVVPADRAVAWLTALNDARLALGTLLAVGEGDDLHEELDAYEQQLIGGQLVEDEQEADAEAGERALRAYRIAVYDFLSALLDMVVRALDR